MAKARGIQVGGARPRTGKEAAAAVAVAGAAAVGGKLAWDRLSGASDDGFARAYRLHDAEPVPDGIRRIARGQLESARGDLDGVSTRKLDEAVHETRKRLKRLRRRGHPVGRAAAGARRRPARRWHSGELAAG